MPGLSGAPVLVYDGSCGFCVATVMRLVRRGVVGLEDCRALQAFAGQERARLVEAGIRNELVVIEPGGALVAGIDGLRVLYRHAGRDAKAGLLTFPPTRALAAFAYGIVASNRRVVSPVDAEVRVRCDCDPEPRAGCRIAFVVLMLGIAVTGAAGLGALLGAWSGAGVWSGAQLGLGIPVLLVLATLFLLPLAPRGKRGEAVAHVALQVANAVRLGVLAVSALLLWVVVVGGGAFLLSIATGWGRGLELLAWGYGGLWFAVATVGFVVVVVVFVTGMPDRLRALGVRA